MTNILNTIRNNIKVCHFCYDVFYEKDGFILFPESVPICQECAKKLYLELDGLKRKGDLVI